MTAPIALFVYNRPHYTEQTLESLAANDLATESHLIVYCDGPKSGASEEDLAAIREVRKIVRKKMWCGRVTIHESDRNKGLADSIVAGVTEVVNQYGKVIVIEDDLLFSKYFLRFMNDGLTLYLDMKNVYSINGYMFAIDAPEVKTFLSPLGTSTLGWGTWQDRWQAFKTEIDSRNREIIINNKFVRSRFNIADYDYTSMMDSRTSWGIRWYYSVFLRNGLGLFVSHSLVKHIGWGPGATNAPNEYQQAEPYEENVKVKLHTNIDLEMHERILKYFMRPAATTSNPLLFRVKKKIFKILKRYL